MIYYTISNWNVFRMKGSVFPNSTRAALPCAFFGAMIRWAINEGYCNFLEADDSILTQTQAWAGFSVLVGFLIIFRSSQAYSRFWDGCTATHHMRADWFDACSVLISFTELSKAPREKIAEFKHMLIRLVSMMHSAALMDLEEMNNTWGTMSDVKADLYELLDPEGLDDESLKTLKHSRERVSLIFQWIQLLVVHNMDAGVLAVPPPIISRAYQELASGMVAFHDCVKISDTPFPFPYAQNCELLLCLHWVLVPFVVSQWVTQAFWAFIFVFMQVFVLWSLNYLAAEIENPFGTDDNSIDGFHMQEEMNRHLLLLLDPRTLRLPHISERAVFSVEPQQLPWDKVKKKSFHDIWFKKKKKKGRKRKSSPTASGTMTVTGDDDVDSDASSSSSDDSALTIDMLEESQSLASTLRQEAAEPSGAPGEPSTKLPPPLSLRGPGGPWAVLQEVSSPGRKVNGDFRNGDRGQEVESGNPDIWGASLAPHPEDRPPDEQSDEEDAADLSDCGKGGRKGSSSGPSGRKGRGRGRGKRRWS